MKNKISSREILVNEIRFAANPVMYLFGFIETETGFNPVRFVCSKRELYRLLTQNGKAGDEIISLIQRLPKEPHSSPLSIDLVEHFGITVPLKAFAIQMQIPFPEKTSRAKDDGESNVMFIERVVPFSAA